MLKPTTVLRPRRGDGVLWWTCLYVSTPPELHVRFSPIFSAYYFAFSALTLLVGRQEGHPACKKTERWGAGMVICLERCADLHMAQQMPLPLTVPCFSKIQIGFIFLVPAHPGSPGHRAVKRVCVRVRVTRVRMCVCVCVCVCVCFCLLHTVVPRSSCGGVATYYVLRAHTNDVITSSCTGQRLNWGRDPTGSQIRHLLFEINYL